MTWLFSLAAKFPFKGVYVENFTFLVSISIAGYTRFSKKYLFEAKILEILQLLVHSPNTCNREAGSGQSQEVHPGFPRGWQEPRYLSHSLLSSRQTGRKLDWKQRWGTIPVTQIWKAAIPSIGLTCYITIVALNKSFLVPSSETLLWLKPKCIFHKVC